MALNPLSARDKQKGLLRTDIVQTLDTAQQANVRTAIGAPPATRSISTAANSGLSGGGNMTANRSLSLAGMAAAIRDLTGAGTGFIVKLVGDNAVLRSFGVGNGLTGENLGGQAGNPTISLGTPSPITRTSTSSTTANSHSHELPQAAFRDMLANHIGVNQIGSLMFATYTGPDRLYGETVSGSTLRPFSDNGIQPGSDIAGQWRCLGYGRNGSSTLWLKISN